ncbi:MAG: hypothetical protein Q9163_000269 [Psora crenata]
MKTFDFCQSPDKDSGYATQSDDLCKDLFDLDDDLALGSWQLDIDSAGQDSLEAFDFNYDMEADTASSKSNVSNKGLEQLPSISNISAPTRGPSALRGRSALPHPNQLNPSISGTELLTIEGKLRSDDSVPLRSPATETPTLRRKGKFCVPTDTLQGRVQQLSKVSSKNSIRPYDHKHEMPSYHEWTQRFGQISLQPPETAQGLSQSPSQRPTQPETVRSPYCQSPAPPIGHRKTVSEQVIPAHRLQQRQVTSDSPHMPSRGSALDLSAQAHVYAGAISDSYRVHGSLDGQVNSTPQHSRHPASWGQSPAIPIHHGHTVSPIQLGTRWEHDLHEYTGSYWDNSQQCEALPDYSMQDYSTMCNPYFQFDYDSTNHYQASNMQQSETSNQDQHNFGSYSSLIRPKTPPPGTTSATALAHEPLTSSHHTRSGKRRSKAGALRLPKSAGNLKGTKSSRDLRSPKSAGGLRTSKSTAGLKSPGEFGFVNFTPSDSGKILTGVAPSGSSKTKARREHEANEKKRRLSMAAEKAIRAAGGDPEQLRREGLL